MTESEEKEILRLIKSNLRIEIGEDCPSGRIEVALRCGDELISKDCFYLPTTDA
jgi:hypothetical protein